MNNQYQSKQYKRFTPEQRQAYRDYQVKRYHSLNEDKKEQYKSRNRLRIQKQREFINSIKLHYGCMNPNCRSGKDLHPIALDLHHLDPTLKKYDIGKYLSLGNLIAELRKCVVLCAICHRLTHYGELDISSLIPCQIDDSGKILGVGI